MNNPTNTNVIIGSQLALAMAMAKGSPVQAQFANPSERKRMMVARMARRCDSIKKRSRELLDEMKAHDAEFAADAARMKSAPIKAKTDLMTKVVGKMVEQQVATHSRMETMLDEMMELIRSNRESIS